MGSDDPKVVPEIDEGMAWVNCPYCGCMHMHGIGLREQVEARKTGIYAHRISHCSGPHKGGGYFLVRSKARGAELPTEE